ncbi:MAG TPA: VWA domain-containing protein [Thermoanaerobaculia bacterium]|nr:VWA domain-containing protein [Thermoanaerobaculia bacterium]
MKRLFPFVILLIAIAARAQLAPVRITQKPQGLVHGLLYVPVSTTDAVARVELLINGVKWNDAPARRSLVIPVHVGEYLRRLRLRVVGYDAQNNIAGEDEMVVNDPRPPFRVHLNAPAALPPAGRASLSAVIVKPAELAVAGVDFFVGESKIASVAAPPYETSFDPSKFSRTIYARVVARGSGGEEANDVFFWGTEPRDQIDVTLQQIPLSVAARGKPLHLEDLALIDDGKPRRIEALVPAADQPLYAVILIDYSESMIEEMPVVKAAAKQFAQRLLRPQDRLAVVGFNQTTFWLTGWTNDPEAVARVVDRVKPGGETHLYDTGIEMLFELQKQPGRHALVIFTDGVDQGSTFTLDHLIHYARYAGVPIYPVIKNRMLSRMMRFGIGKLEAHKLTNVARDTGATYFIIQQEKELPEVYGKIADELRQQYQLVFYSDASTKDQWHSLAITSKGDQQLRVPKGYFP